MIKSHHITAIFIAGMLALIYGVFSGAPAGWWAASFLMYFAMSCLGITITFHRCLTHNSFKFRYRWMKDIFTMLGTLAGTGSAISWVAVHRTHHEHSDKEHDPHGPHIGWRNFFNNYDYSMKYITVRDLVSDPALKWMHQHGIALYVIFYSLLLMFGGLYGLVFLGLVPQLMVITMSTVSNYFSHMSGYKTYDIDDESRNNWWLALPTWGESWHNNHHAKPHLYSFSHKWWEIDISGMIIKLIKE